MSEQISLLNDKIDNLDSKMNMLFDKINTSKIYDFSERHMDYSTSNSFLNNATSPFGYNRKVNQGGSWNMASSYLTNGSGAINEYQMPFENNENLIHISEISSGYVKNINDYIKIKDKIYNKNNIILLTERHTESEIQNDI